MKRKIASIILALAMILSLIPGTVFAGEGAGSVPADALAYGTCGENGDNLTWSLSQDGTLTISGTGAMGYQTPWMSYKDSIKSLVIEEGVTTVGQSAFFGCDQLTSVTLPTSLEKIEAQAFRSCAGLKEITIPAGVSEIDTCAFADCSALVEIKVDSKNTAFMAQEGVLFSGDLSELIVWPAGKTGAYDIPAETRTVNAFAFSGCSGLTTITIPEGVIAIHNNAFQNCTGLMSVVLPKGLQSIEPQLFYGCTGLKEITIPSSVTVINDYAFSGCSSLQLVHFTGTESAWNKITIYSDNEELLEAQRTYGTDGPCGTCGDNLKWELSDAGVLTISGTGEMSFEWGGVSWKNYSQDIKSVVIEEGVISIARYAFSDCTALTSVTIPASVTSVEGNAFSGCTALADVVIPSSITKIESFAFSRCTSLAEITIPDGVTDIGYGAFEYCSKLTSVSIPESVTVIGTGAFSNCSSLTGIMIPNSVTYISYNAFGNCSKLTSVFIPESVTVIGHGAFSGCTSMESFRVAQENPSFTDEDGVLFSKDMGVLLSYPAGKNGNNYRMPDSVEFIEYEAFDNCINLTSVTLGSRFNGGSFDTFKNCPKLQEIIVSDENGVYCSVDGVLFTKDMSELVLFPVGKSGSYTIPDGVTGIRSTVFSGCTGLTAVTIPDSVKKIWGRAFYGCTGLTKVTMGSGVTEICTEAFSNCTALTEIVIPDGVSYISPYIFLGCSQLKNVTIPTSVQFMCGSAFYGCSDLNITFTGSETAWENIVRVDGNDALSSATVRCTGTAEDPAPLNKEMSTAREISVGQEVTVKNANLATFYYQFTAAESGQYLTSVFRDGRSAYLRIFDAEGSLIAGSENTPVWSLTAELEAGKTYYLAVFANYWGADAIDLTLTVNRAVSQGDYIGILRGDDSLQLVEYTGQAVSEITVPETLGGYAVKSIGRELFGDKRYGLTSVTLPKGVTEIAYMAFAYCHSLQKISIPDALQEIGQSAFLNCYNIEKICLPDTLITIGDNAFGSAWGTAFFFAGSEEQWNAVAIGSGNEPLADKKIHFNVTDHPYDENGICTVCGYAGPNHTNHVMSDGYHCTEDGHWQICKYCGEAMTAAQPHTYNEAGFCTVCGYVKANHTHKMAEWYQSDANGHWRVCEYCNEPMTEAQGHSYDENGICPLCGYAGPDHTNHVMSDGYWRDENGHWKACTCCGEPMTETEAHVFNEDGACTVCGYAKANHTHKMAEGYRSDADGHWQGCRYCDEMVGSKQEHSYDSHDICTVCGFVSPNHKHVIWKNVYYHAEGGHMNVCKYCRVVMEDTFQAHTFKRNYCTACGEVDPNHKCVAATWYDSDSEGHWNCCKICYERMGEQEKHTFANDRCAVCGEVDPKHTCQTDPYYYFCDENGHGEMCRICGNKMPDSELQAHTWDTTGIYCIVCGADNPEHECVADDEVYYQDGAHYKYCKYCYRTMEEVAGEHDFVDGRCTICGEADSNHLHYYSYWTDEEYSPDSHTRECVVCHISSKQPHEFDANGICTVCGAWSQEKQAQITAIELTLNDKKQIVMTLTMQGGTRQTLTITGVYANYGTKKLFENNACVGSWNRGNIRTDKGLLEMLWYSYDDGRFSVEMVAKDGNGVRIKTIGSHDWLNVYYAAQEKAFISDPVCAFENDAWTVTGHADDGRIASVTMDAAGNVIGQVEKKDPKAAEITTKTDEVTGAKVIESVTGAEDSKGNVTVIDVSKDGDTTAVQVDAKVVDTVSKDKTIQIKLDKDGTQVKITPEAMDQIKQNREGLDSTKPLTISVTERMEPSAANWEAFQRASANNSGLKVLDLKLSVAGESVFDEDNAAGIVQVAIPVGDLPVGSQIKLYYLNGSEYEEVKNVKVENGMLIMYLEHFSEYVAVTVEEEKEDSEEQIHTHNYEYTETVAPTCEAMGYDLYTCECGQTERKNYAPAAHSYSSDHICTHCGAEDEAVSMEIVQQPDTLTYEQHTGVLDITGGRVKITYRSGAVEELDMTEAMVTGFDNTKAGTLFLTVTVGKLQRSFQVEITVKIICGDVNGDGVVNMRDLGALRKYFAGGYDADNFVVEAADVSGDGVVTMKDLGILRRYLAGGYDIELG